MDIEAERQAELEEHKKRAVEKAQQKEQGKKPKSTWSVQSLSKSEYAIWRVNTTFFSQSRSIGIDNYFWASEQEDVYKHVYCTMGKFKVCPQQQINFAYLAKKADYFGQAVLIVDALGPRHLMER